MLMDFIAYSCSGVEFLWLYGDTSRLRTDSITLIEHATGRREILKVHDQAWKCRNLQPDFVCMLPDKLPIINPSDKIMHIVMLISEDSNLPLFILTFTRGCSVRHSYKESDGRCLSRGSKIHLGKYQWLNSMLLTVDVLLSSAAPQRLEDRRLYLKSQEQGVSASLNV